jgi:hypothetical protein
MNSTKTKKLILKTINFEKWVRSKIDFKTQNEQFDLAQKLFNQQLAHFIFRFKSKHKNLPVIEAFNKLDGSSRDYLLFDEDEELFLQLFNLDIPEEQNARKALKTFNRILIKLAVIKSKRKVHEADNDILQTDIVHWLRQIVEFDVHYGYEKIRRLLELEELSPCQTVYEEPLRVTEKDLMVRK